MDTEEEHARLRKASAKVLRCEHGGATAGVGRGVGGARVKEDEVKEG